MRESDHDPTQNKNNIFTLVEAQSEFEYCRVRKAVTLALQLQTSNHISNVRVQMLKGAPPMFSSSQCRNRNKDKDGSSGLKFPVSLVYFSFMVLAKRAAAAATATVANASVPPLIPSSVTAHLLQHLRWRGGGGGCAPVACTSSISTVRSLWTRLLISSRITLSQISLLIPVNCMDGGVEPNWRYVRHVDEPSYWALPGGDS
ncbi:hypothetical protein LWI29_029759 [Acer saccharum]|uniref:Uncharacterized protein n=1 Tax=Acer saccharum TaxID=4024 RepID=A0AA39VS71_ACESA|nr:hypothetical protein LWI29_029759 [Acer saccharum]